MKLAGKNLFASLVVALLATACLGFGSWFHDSSHRVAKVNLAQATKLQNGDVLPAGTYQIVIAKNSTNPTVNFYKVYTQGGYNSLPTTEGKAAASVPAKVVTESQKNPETEVLAHAQGDTQVLTSIQPAGWHEKLVFSPNNQSSSN